MSRSQVELLDDLLEKGQQSLSFFSKRDFSTESPGFRDHFFNIVKMAYHAFDIMEPVSREWAELRDGESIIKTEDEMLDPSNMRKMISPQTKKDARKEQINAHSVSVEVFTSNLLECKAASSDVTPPSQDVSFSTQPGRELPITVQVRTEVATAVTNSESVEVLTSNSF